MKKEQRDTGRHGFVAIILAAGYSSRMKSFKPLLPIGELTAVERLTESAKTAGINDIVVVTGYSREKLQPVLNMTGAHEAYNRKYDSGMFSSVQAGLKRAGELFPYATGYFLMPVDCPLIDSDVIIALTEHAEKKPDLFCVPAFEGKKGHPLFIPRKYGSEICGYAGDGGLKAITDKYWDKMMRIPVGSEGCLLDMDTPQGYEDILSFWNNGCRRSDIIQLAEGRRIFLIRHGQTRQHDEKMMIGQYDVPLNDEGREQMKKTAAALLQHEVNTGSIYSSDLERAAESAEIIREHIGFWEHTEGENMKIINEKGFREISLGGWDGLPIREIKEKYPDEYRRRGEDIFTFKIGNKAENFYDLQYRAVAALRKILEKDMSRDVIIVTHSGVIRALENNLKGMRVDDEWKSLPKGGFTMVTV